MKLFVFEHRRQRPLPLRAFLLRLAQQVGVAGIVIFGSLGIGMAGYHWLGGFAWIDSFLNAAMILGGMGPVGDLKTSAAKIFAGVYALYAGMVFLVAAAIVLTPVFHRVLHRFHWDAEHSQD
jgi:hypothetical protein